MRSVTISNVYLNFGGKGHGNIFVGMLNQGSLLAYYTVCFPKSVDEVVKGQQYYKTNWTLSNFVNKG